MRALRGTAISEEGSSVLEILEVIILSSFVLFFIIPGDQQERFK